MTNPEIARQYGARPEHVDLPFVLEERGVNGTGLLMSYLQKLEGQGIAYVSDLSYALQMRHNGKDIECISKIAVADGTAVPTTEKAGEPADAGEPDEPEYSTTVKAWQPKIADQWVVDRELSCKQRAQQVTLAEPSAYYDTTYTAEIGNGTPFAHRRPDNTAIVFYDQCTYEPERRFVHRYEHFIAARFTPPELEVIRRSYADFALVDEPPLCHEIQREPGRPFRQHISANAYYPSHVQRDRENVYRIQTPVPSSGKE